jgi:hypothetical protein
MKGWEESGDVHRILVSRGTMDNFLTTLYPVHGAAPRWDLDKRSSIRWPSFLIYMQNITDRILIRSLPRRSSIPVLAFLFSSAAHLAFSLETKLPP